MKKILFILLVFIAASCSKDFEEMNTNVKSAEAVTGETLFSNAEKNLADQLASINVNRNIWKIWAQYVTETTYTEEANYDIINRSVPDNAFRTFYRDILMDLKKAEAIIAAVEYKDQNTIIRDKAVQANKLAMIEILNVYSYARLVDMFGNIPYSKALDIDNTTPKYDDAWEIYQDLFKRLDAAIANLDDNYGSYGSVDLYYSGNVTNWKLFANSLKLKLAIHISKYDTPTARTNAEAAFTNGVISNAGENTSLVYLATSPNTNPLYVDLVASGRHDFVGTYTIINPMDSLADPRLPLYYTQVDTSSEDGVVKLAFVGATYGKNSKYSAHSHLYNTVTNPTFECLLMSYTEVEFYLAEAAALGYSVGGDAESHYNAGVAASIEYWGGTSADAATYLATPGVAYSTAFGGEWSKAVAFQSWVASYNRGFIGWTTYRRLGFPNLVSPPSPETEDGSVPKRFTYPVNEQTLNGDNYKDAAAATVGGDKLSSPLFWDL